MPMSLSLVGVAKVRHSIRTKFFSFRTYISSASKASNLSTVFSELILFVSLAREGDWLSERTGSCHLGRRTCVLLTTYVIRHCVSSDEFNRTVRCPNPDFDSPRLHLSIHSLSCSQTGWWFGGIIVAPSSSATGGGANVGGERGFFPSTFISTAGERTGLQFDFVFHIYIYIYTVPPISVAKFLRLDAASQQPIVAMTTTAAAATTTSDTSHKRRSSEMA
jgi:hypothetical protein